MAEPADTTKTAMEGKPVSSPMEDQVQKLAEKVWKKYQGLDESQRYLIALAGIPGSGKTTFAASLAYRLNILYQDEYHRKYPNAPDYRLERHRHDSNSSAREIAFVLPMDGFHLTRAQLSAMEDPEEAHFRRGAAFTFDDEAYLRLIEKIRKPIEPGTRTIWAPSFDHAIKDPVKDDIAIPPTARVVIIEGLYTALSYPAPKTASPTKDTKAAVPSCWSEACDLMDEIWLISVPIPTATERVAKRNFRAGLSPSLEAAFERTINNDMINAREILDNLPSKDKLIEQIESIEDEGWMTEEQKMALEKEQREEDQQKRDKDLKKMRLERMGSIAEMADAGCGM